MNTLKFKTNVKCGGCIAAVTPHLNKVEGIKSWNVDINDPQRILTVETEKLSAEAIVLVMKNAGYQADLIIL
jgi:copper chaperone